MNQISRSFAVIVVLSMFALVPMASADDAKRQAPTTAGATDLRRHPGGLIETGWLIDRPIRDAQREEIGKIKHVWFDPKTGQIKEVVVEVSGVLGIGEQHKLLAWKDVDVAWDDQKLVVVVDRNVLRNAKKYDAAAPAASPR